MIDLARLELVSEFSLPLSMGEVHVRAITSSDLNELETLARSDASDADVVRRALKLADRHRARAEGEKRSDDNGETGEDIAKVATLDDLEAVAENLLVKLRYIYMGPDHEDDELKKEGDETSLAFLRRALKTHEERTQKHFAKLAKQSKERSDRLMLEGAAASAEIMRHQNKVRATFLRGAEALPRVEERLEASARSSERFNRTTINIAVGSLAVASVSLIVAVAAVVKSVQDDPKIDGAMETLKKMQQESKATSDQLRALRDQLGPKPSPPLPPDRELRTPAIGTTPKK